MKRKISSKILALLLSVAISLPAAGAVTLMASAAENAEPSGQTRVVGGDFANVVVFARFQDDHISENYLNEDSDKTTGDNTVMEEIMHFYDGDYGRSFTNYMETVSNGQLHVKNLFPQYDEITGQTSVITLPYNYDDVRAKDIDYQVIGQIIEEMPELKGLTVDYDGDGYIDNFTVILFGGVDTIYSHVPTLYPHCDNYLGTENVPGTDKKVSYYNILTTNTLLDGSLLGANRHGLIIHEFLHTLGYPDLYTRDGRSYPVYSWDIMAERSIYPAYPLAVLRETTGWAELPVIEEDTTLTLESPQTAVEGKPYAYAIKSPLNPYELFVVERREQGDAIDPDSLDAKIGGSGVIVYRVNTTVKDLSNFGSKLGIYVFRPNAEDTREAALQAAFPRSDGSNYIGNESIEAGISEGALTFSDGSNSGIVISDIRKNTDGTMSLEVKLPDADAYDMWEDTRLVNSVPGQSATHAAVGTIDGKQYAAAVQQTGTTDGSKPTYIYFYEYTETENSQWTSVWKSITVPVAGIGGGGTLRDLKLIDVNGTPVVAYTNNQRKLFLKSWNGSSWVDAGGSGMPGVVASWDAEVSGSELYLAFTEDSGDASLAAFSFGSNKALTAAGPAERFTGGFLGNASVSVAGGKIYTAVRDAGWNGAYRISLYEYNKEKETFKTLTGLTDSDLGITNNSTAYSMSAYNGNLYITATRGTDKLLLFRYESDVDTWTKTVEGDIDSFTPELMVVEGNFYVMTSPASENGEGTKLYRIEGDRFVQEGIQIDAGRGRGFSLAASGDVMFAAYSVDQTSMEDDLSKSALGYVKKKSTTDKLLSITVEPPSQTSYLVGDAVSLEGLKVTANYSQSGSRTLSEGEYEVTGFHADTAGERTATVTFGTVTGEFSYKVSDPVVVTELALKVKAPQAGEFPTTSVQVSAPGITVDQVRWSSSEPSWSEEEAFDYGQTYTVTVKVSADRMYALSSALTATVNENEASVTLSGASAEISYTFQPMSAPVIQSVTAAFAEGVSPYLEKDSGLEKTDLVVTARLSDNSTRKLAESEYALDAATDVLGQYQAAVTLIENEQIKTTLDYQVWKTISNIALEIENPVYGQKPALGAQSDSEGFNGATVTWSPADGQFEYDTQYTAAASVNLKNFYRVDKNVSVTVNGTEQGVTITPGNAISTSDGYYSGLTVEKDFGALKKPVIQQITAKPSAGSSLEYEAGEEMEKGDVIVTARLSDGKDRRLEESEYTVTASASAPGEYTARITLTEDPSIQTEISYTVYQTLTAVTVTAGAPVLDEKPAVTASVAEKGIAVSGDVAWSPADDTFRPEVVYTASVTLKTEKYYRFSRDISCIFDGASGVEQGVSVSENIDGTLTVSRTYEELPAPEVKIVSITAGPVAPGTLKYEAGDEPRPEDISVTALLSNGETRTLAYSEYTVIGNTDTPGLGELVVNVADAPDIETKVPCEIWKTLSEINLTLEAPTYGKAPAKEGKAQEKGVTAGAVTWQPQQDTFVFHTVYSASTILTADAYYRFGDNISVKVNGSAEGVDVQIQAAEGVARQSVGEQAVVSVNFGEIPLPDDIEHYKRKEPTTTEEGNIEYWYVPSLDKYFADGDLRTQIEKKDTVIPPKEASAVESIVSVAPSTPGKTLRYEQGSSLFSADLTVVAAFSDGTVRQLAPDEYEVIGQTDALGVNTASIRLVSNPSVTGTVTYEVWKTISQVGLSLTAPAQGQTPATSAKMDTTGVQAASVSWNPAEQTFRYGVSYTASVELKLEEWHRLSGTVTALVNGSADGVAVEYTQDSAIVKKTFAALSSTGGAPDQSVQGSSQVPGSTDAAASVATGESSEGLLTAGVLAVMAAIGAVGTAAVRRRQHNRTKKGQ
ncbi:MAG TPA: bacterial Ig-like domain-containing protein [Candidatus Mediterraneibacter intestinipullorum]|nr:bacterial Ig-like domain-containing protein [Candidatus Mediterraneibacter intestinipullorum]